MHTQFKEQCHGCGARFLREAGSNDEIYMGGPGRGPLPLCEDCQTNYEIEAGGWRAIRDLPSNELEPEFYDSVKEWARLNMVYRFVDNPPETLEQVQQLNAAIRKVKLSEIEEGDHKNLMRSMQSARDLCAKMVTEATDAMAACCDLAFIKEVQS